MSKKAIEQIIKGIDAVLSDEQLWSSGRKILKSIKEDVQAIALRNQPEPSEITTIDNKPLWARNFLTSLMYEPNQAECIQQRIQEVISIIDQQAADIIQKDKEIAWEICKVNFRDSQLRDERDENRKFRLDKPCPCCGHKGTDVHTCNKSKCKIVVELQARINKLYKNYKVDEIEQLRLQLLKLSERRINDMNYDDIALKEIKKLKNEIEKLKAEREGHIDFIDQLETEIEGLKKSDNILTALEAAGVDNWEGYDEAMTILEEQALTDKTEDK